MTTLTRSAASRRRCTGDMYGFIREIPCAELIDVDLHLVIGHAPIGPTEPGLEITDRPVGSAPAAGSVPADHPFRPEARWLGVIADSHTLKNV
jgi:hypothetical protein